MSSSKYKLIVSDLHMGKGRLLEDGSINTLEEFYFDEKFVEFLSYHGSGEFQGAGVELILNGDFLDFLQVDYRGHFLTTLTEEISCEILRSIIAGHPKVFRALSLFAREPGNSVVYIVGNRDQPMLWPEVQKLFKEVVGSDVRFCSMVYRERGLHIEHGHRLEAANQFNPKKFFLRKNLPEPILNLPFGSHFFSDVILDIKKEHPHVDRVRPTKRLVRWALFNETAFTLRTFFKILAYFFHSFFRKEFYRDISLLRVAKVFFQATWVPDLMSSAQKILESDDVHTVVFGHTYIYKYRQFGPNKEYFNTGTWTELTSLEIPNMGVVTKLTYVLVEDREERPYCRLKQWRGYHRVEEDVVIS